MKIPISEQNFLEKIASDPGVYQYFDKNNNIIYVGKAKNLRKRISSYFKNDHIDQKTRILVRLIFSIEYFIVDSEIDALLLENNLIKQHQPKYNILLKDDKTFPWIVINNEPFPRVFTTRKKIKDGSQYFGPYPKGRIMQNVLTLIRELYPIRTCRLDLNSENIDKKKYKVCLEYHLKRCNGPCEGLESALKYQEYIQNITLLLSGKTFSLLGQLKKQMKIASENLDFETAEVLKNNIHLLEAYRSKSIIVNEDDFTCDVLTLVKKDNSIYYNYLWIREGQIAFGYSNMIQPKLDETEIEIAPILLQYLHSQFQSKQFKILINLPINTQIGPFKFTQPKIGSKANLITLSLKNTQLEILAHTNKPKKPNINKPDNHSIILKMQIDLHLTKEPKHIECFDNSNIQGTNAVAACVVFKDGLPSKKDYRHFNIKTVVGPDDFASMSEIIGRRYSRILNEKSPLPDLIIIDGGKGQLSSALEVLDSLQLRGKIAIIGIAKKQEEIYFPGDKNPIILSRNDSTLKLIQQLRDEAHRFGITHHRNKRSSQFISSELDEIQGIGKKSKQSLFKSFSSLDKIKNASKEELIRSIGKSKGEKLFHQFH